MTTCISRRAFSDKFSFRLINEKGENGKWIWMEYRCTTPVTNEGDVCVGCSVKLPKYKYQAQQKCNHGHVGGPYPADSKLYGSGYYLGEIKGGWKISEHDELRAKAAVDKANSNMAPRKKSTVAPPEAIPVTVTPVVAAPVVAAPVVAAPTKRPYVRKTAEQKAALAEKAAARVPRTKKETKTKTEVLLPQIPVTENTLEPKFVEVKAQPITITDIIVVKVKKSKIHGKDYYYDSASGKLYGISVNGVGAYKGRYNEEEDMIDTTFPDSDDE